MLTVMLIQIPQPMQETSKETADGQQIIWAEVKEGFDRAFYNFFLNCIMDNKLEKGAWTLCQRTIKKCCNKAVAFFWLIALAREKLEAKLLPTVLDISLNPTIFHKTQFWCSPPSSSWRVPLLFRKVSILIHALFKYLWTGSTLEVC